MSDAEARARELLNMIRHDFMADAAFAHVVAALSAAELRGEILGMGEGLLHFDYGGNPRSGVFEIRIEELRARLAALTSKEGTAL